MNRIEIEDKIREMVSSQFGVSLEEVDLDTRFIEDLNADSLDAVEVVMLVEDEFNLKIPDEIADRFFSVKLVVEYIEKNIKS